MTRTARFVFVGLALATPAWGSGKGAQAKLSAFRAEAAKQRAARGFDLEDPKLLAEYPPPELTFAPGAEVPLVCPGQGLEVKLTGRFQPGSVVVVLSDEVEVSKERLTPAAWEARVKVRENVPPGDVLAKVLSPVSEAARVVRLLDVGCRHRWVLNMGHGERLEFTTQWPKGANTGVESTGTWSKEGRNLGSVPLSVRGGGTAFTLERKVGAEEVAAREQVRTSGEVKTAEAGLKEAQRKLNSCSKGPQGQQQACLRSGGEEVTRLSVARDALVQKILGPHQPRFGCDAIRVRVGPEGVVGEASRCAMGSGTTSVKGTIVSEAKR